NAGPSGQRADNGVRITVAHAVGRGAVGEKVGLVEEEHGFSPVALQLVYLPVDGLDVRLNIGCGEVHNMYKEIGVLYLFERRLERLYKVRRKVPYKADRVGEKALHPF